MSEPKVSVIIPVKNRRELLGRTLESVRAQTEQRWEAWVVDDGSTDGARELAEDFAAADPRIHAVNRTREASGAPACRNEGVERARGMYIVFLDGDDLLAPGALEARVKAMAASPVLDFGVTLAGVFGANAEQRPESSGRLWNVPTDEDEVVRFLALDIPWQTTSPTWRRAALDRLGPWDESLPSWQDWEYHLRALLMGLRHAWIGDDEGEPDCFWRQPTGQTIGAGSLAPDRLELYGALLLSIKEKAIVHNAWGAQRQEAAIGLANWIGQKRLRFDNLDRAQTVWRELAEELGADGKHVVQGKRALRLAALPRGARWARRYRSAVWPRHMLAGTSKTFRRPRRA